MKKLLLLVNLLPLCELSKAQNLTLPVVTSGHGSGQSGNVFLEWSIGEMAVATRKSGPNILSEGFLQPDPSYAFPVKLIYFNGKPAGASNELNWATSEETNNSHFEVQKSPDGIHFQAMERVTGAGTVYAKKSYQITDGSPYPNTYYRLKQVDYDGTFSYSSIIYIRQTDHSGYALHPNPAVDMLYLSGFKNGGPLHIAIFKTRGDAVLQQTCDARDGININIKQLHPGSYLIQVSGPFAWPLWTSRFIKF